MSNDIVTATEVVLMISHFFSDIDSQTCHMIYKKLRDELLLLLLYIYIYI